MNRAPQLRGTGRHPALWVVTGRDPAKGDGRMYTVTGGDILRLPSTFLLLPIWLAAGIAQTLSPADFDHLDLAADKLIRNDSVIHGLGHARAKLGGLVLQGDEITAHSDTGQVELRGHVQATLPARSPDHSVFRYGSGTLVTDKPVTVQADRLSVKYELLQAWGNITVRPVDTKPVDVPKLQADEMFMYLRIGDAELRGNVRPKIAPRPRSFPVLPPDIIK
jgi:hypothetical protein